MNETNLKKKLGSLGIPTSGSKALLSRRHTEYVNMWNANCDSSMPKGKRQILQELDIWERSQGSVQVNPNTVMNKNFDGKAWSSTHGTDFQQLIAQARGRPEIPGDKEQPHNIVSSTEVTTITSQPPKGQFSDSHGRGS